MQVVALRPEQLGHEAQRLPLRPERHPRLPPGVEHAAAVQPPCASSGVPLRQQAPTIRVENGNSTPAEQFGRCLDVRASSERLHPRFDARQIEVVDVVAGDDVRIGFAHQTGQPFEDLALAAAECVLGALVSPLHDGRRAQDGLLGDRRLQVEREQHERRWKRLALGDLGQVATDDQVHRVESLASRLADALSRFRSGLISPMSVGQSGQQFLWRTVRSPQHLGIGTDVRTDIVVVEQPVDEHDVRTCRLPVSLQFLTYTRSGGHRPRLFDLHSPMRLGPEFGPLLLWLMNACHAVRLTYPLKSLLDVLREFSRRPSGDGYLQVRSHPMDQQQH